MSPSWWLSFPTNSASSEAAKPFVFEAARVTSSTGQRMPAQGGKKRAPKL